MKETSQNHPMRLKNHALSFLVFCLFLVFLATGSVFAQQVDVRILSQDAEGVTVEMTADWRLSLREAMDSSRASSLTPALVNIASNGNEEISELIYLPSRQRPRVDILESSFDELSVPPHADHNKLVMGLDGPVASLFGLGTYRKKPVVSLSFQPVVYDGSSSSLRRFRKVVARVTYASSGGQFTLSQANAVSQNEHVLVDQSALSEGIIVKIPVTREGIYRIDRAFLTDAGLTPDTIDPDRIHILGNGGAPLPALNGTSRPADLVQNPVFRTGGGDGSFGDNDAILFYAASPTGWEYNVEDGEWNHYVNPFSVENYYFLKVAGENGLNVGNPAFVNLPGATTYSSVPGRLFVDFDQFNWSKQNGSGLTWVSNPIDPTGRLDILRDTIPPGFNGGEIDYQVRVAIKSNPSTPAVFNSGGAQIGSARAGSVQPGENDPSARLAITNFTDTKGAGESMDLSMTIQQQSNNPEAGLDWMRAIYEQSLMARNGVVRFVTPAGVTGPLSFLLSGFTAEPHVWDVSSHGEISRLGVRASGGNYEVQIDVADTPRELIAFIPEAANGLDSGNASTIANQNLHGIQEFPDFVIVAPPPFLMYAEELADIRRQEGMTVTVANIEQIYNEFSGGLVDMRSVRDYLRFLYDRAPSDELRIKYALFYGDGHYNYRNLGSDSGGLENWIPPYETVDSFTPDRTFTSDDYFGLLDSEEGEWVYDGFGFPNPTAIPPQDEDVDRVDIGVGRFTVQTAEEAQVVLEKLKRYEDPATYGPWRTRYTFVADDDLTGLSGTDDEADLHLQNADVVAELIKDQFGEVNIRKIYASSFNRVFRNGHKIPEARDEIINSLEEGTLLINYSGHGGEEGLAQEGIFTAEDARNLENFDRLAIFVTATCSFGWWDLSLYQSGAEELLLNPNGGAVALLTTVRLVYTSASLNSLNVGLNRQLAREMFTLEDDGEFRRLGDILRITKNTRVGLQGNNRKFNLLGDPTLRVGLPGNNKRLEIESINGVDLSENEGQLRALDQVSIEGTVRAKDGTIDDTYQGIVDVTIFDAQRRIPIENKRHMVTPYYTVREDLIWRGQVQAAEGRFTASFVVPKDISYSNLPGRLSVYASSDAGHLLGFNENFIVGGTSDSPPNDSQGPEITLFLNDTTFVSGGLTAPDPKLIVKLFDASGINTVGAGVGHEMLLTINEDAENALDISSGFRSEANSFQRGTVEWDLTDLEPGPNALTLRAWDVLNNSTTSSVEFFVAEEEDLVLRNVYNYPNPTSGETRFVFEHNQPLGTSASVQVRIYTLAGRLIRQLEVDEVLPGGVVQLPWDGRDEDADLIATGVYLYKLRVEVESPEGDRQVSEKLERLAIIR